MTDTDLHRFQVFIRIPSGDVNQFSMWGADRNDVYARLEQESRGPAREVVSVTEVHP